jgi:GNAT superfamily N-acetyltransferase
MTGALRAWTRRLRHVGTPQRGLDSVRHLMLDGTPIELRNGTATDVTALTPMMERICALHQEWDPAKYGFVDEAIPMYRRWLEQRADDPDSVFVVAASADRLLAFAIGTTENAAPIFQPATYGLIRDFWVEDDWRRNNIGRELLRATIDQFHTLGITQIRLETAAANEGARRFFAACGFRPCAIEMLIE